jgi:hypothetical protein
MEVVQPVSLMENGIECAWLWHARFNHLNFRALRSLARRGDGERIDRDRACEAGVHRLSNWKSEAVTISASGSDLS